MTALYSIISTHGKVEEKPDAIPAEKMRKEPKAELKNCTIVHNNDDLSPGREKKAKG
jgi:hypothetical protein